MTLDEIDLAKLCRTLATELATNPPHGYVVGKTTVREHIMTLLGCSALEAEALVDTLETRGFMRYEGERSGAVDDLSHAWVFVSHG